MERRLGRWRPIIAMSAAVATVALTTSCAQSIAAPPPPPAAVRAAAIQQWVDTMWANLRVGDASRPSVDIGAPLNGLTATEAYASCMSKYGYVYELEDNGSYTVSVSTLRREMGSTFDVSRYTCLAENPQGDEIGGLLTSAQRTYIYDYFVEWLVPCLGFAGYDLTQVPSRADFMRDQPHPGWNPYERVPVHGDALQPLTARCSPYPPGVYGY